MSKSFSKAGVQSRDLATIGQKTTVLLSALQTGYLSFSYLAGSINNSFSVLERLFNTETSLQFTESGCWKSIMPFLASAYISITLISILVLFFRGGRELKLIVLGIASVHIVMAAIRLSVASPEFYQQGAALTASTVQLAMAGLLLATLLMRSQKVPITDD